MSDHCPHGVLRGVRCGPCEDERADVLGEVRYAEGESSVMIDIVMAFDDVVDLDVAQPITDLLARFVKMRNALLAVEWTGTEVFQDEDANGDSCAGITEDVCPACFSYGQHGTTCALNAALTAAGLPDQASRDAARKEIGR